MNVLKLYEKFSKYPLGKKAFSLAVCKKAPYFGTISPTIEVLEPGRCFVSMKKKKPVTNHIGSVHAIAMCNLAELSAGMAIDVTLDKTKLRWIPKGMEVKYLKIASTDLHSKCSIESSDLKEGDNQVKVDVFDTNEQLVFTAQINMYVSKK